MGTLANSLFQAMLGWIRTLSAQVWTTASSPDSATLLDWIGENWKALALMLCAAGLIIDLVVYLIRWQPYRVWRSFIRRIGRGKGETEESPAEEEQIQDVPAPAVSAMRMETVTPRYTEARPSQRDYEKEEIYSEAVEEEIREQGWSRNEPEGTTAAFEQAILPRKRRRVTRLFAEEQEETSSPDQLIDRYAAYRRPVYPRSWRAEEGDEEE